MNSAIAMPLLGVLAANDGGATAWSITSLLKNGAEMLRGWGSYIIIILGIVALIAAAYMIVTGLISHGKKQTSWPVAIILLILGGVLFAGGWNMWVGQISATGQSTIQDLATEGKEIEFVGDGSQFQENK